MVIQASRPFGSGRRGKASDGLARRAWESDVNQESARAPRFVLPLVVRYRSDGETGWHDGRIENISRSGMLIRTDEPPAVDTRLEMTFVLPVGKTPPAVVCRGRIVRTVLPTAHGLPGLAATISSFRFVRDADAGR
jgi:hypothetical protein